MDNNNENNEEVSSKLQLFISKMKTDKKYKAKVQLAGYAIVVIVIIIYLNISNITNNYNYEKSVNNTVDTKTETTDDQTDLLEELDDNYVYNVDITLKKIVDNLDDNENSLSEIKYNYNGKSYKNNLIINKKVNDNQITYYKVQNEYYQKEEDTYTKQEESTIYDLIESKYIELDNIKKYLETANLDHYTNYSSGKREYIYNLNLSDLIPSYKESDMVQINIVIEGETVIINIDYTNFFKVLDKKIDECIIVYTYSDINKVEEFNVIENDNKEIESNDNNTIEN
jgi:hypothetical protein